MTPEQAAAGIAKVQQRLANPAPLSDNDRRQIADFLGTVKTYLEAPQTTQPLEVRILPTSVWKVDIGEQFLKGLCFGAGLSVCMTAAGVFLAVISAILAS